MSDVPFAEQLRHYRAAARLSQAELAEAAGVSERAVSDIERGLRTRVYPVTARALADALRLTDEARQIFQRAAQAGRARTATHLRLGENEWRSLLRSPLLGREDELAAFRDALRDAPATLHTITGPGGIGKSRLAAEVCQDYPERAVRWVSLAAVGSAELVLSTVAVAVGLPADTSMTALAAEADNHVELLVLDTFEPVLTAASDVAALLDQVSKTRMLVTSRAPLRVRGERELPLRPLSIPATTELFRQRAAAARPDIGSDDADAMADIAERLAGLPLAVELAAAKVRQMSLVALRDRLDRPLELLDDGERDLPARQRTMRDAIGWSYDLLTPIEKVVFRRLAAFAGGWTLDAAEVVCASAAVPRAAVLSTLGRLSEQALVQVDDRAAERWHLLDPVRDYALEQLEAAGERATTGARHGQAFAGLADLAAPRLVGPGQTAAREELRVEVGNLRLALAEACRAGEADLALRITSGIWMFWRMEGAFREGRNWLHRSLHLAGAQASPHRSGALWGAGWLAYGQGDIGAAKQHADEMLARATGSDTTDRRNALTLLGQVAMAEADFAAAVPLLEEALVIARGTDERWHVATSLLNLGTALLHCDDAIRAQELLAEAVAGHQAVGDTDFVARSTVELGYAALVLGELASARSHFEGALQTFLQLHERWGLAEAVAGAAVLAAAHGDSDTAATLSGASEASYAEIAAQVIVPDAMLGAPFLAEARSAIGEQRWLQAKAAGRLLAIEVAAKAALDWTPPTSSS